MKKKKPPILLISLLLVMIIVPIAMSYKPEQNKTGEAATGESRKEDTKASVADQQKGLLKKPAHSPMQEKMQDGQPSIRMIPRGSAPQKPTDSSIMGQWYNDHSVTQSGEHVKVTSPPR